MSKIGTLISPNLPDGVPSNAQWLSGQGVGVWFSIREQIEDQFLIERYALDGGLDCSKLFTQEENGSIFDINKPYQFTYVSHCNKCRIIQNYKIYVFNNCK